MNRDEGSNLLVRLVAFSVVVTVVVLVVWAVWFVVQSVRRRHDRDGR